MSLAWATADEAAAIGASPSDPAVEYVPAALASRSICRCPRTVLDAEPCSWQLKVLHAAGCVHRANVTGPALERRPAGVHACPDCGNVAFSLVPVEWRLPGWRRCDGPRGCGRGFPPAAEGRPRRPLELGERPAEHGTRRAA